MQYQIIQAEKDRIVVKIVPSRNFDRKLLSALVIDFKQLLSEPVTVEPEVVTLIPKEKSRKYNLVISKVK